TGLVGAPECGDVMKLQMKINPDTQVIEEAKFKTFGCGSAIASSSLATGWVKGKTVEEALSIKNTDIVRELSLPPVKIHCSVLAEDAIKAASGDWRTRRGGEVRVRGGGCAGPSYAMRLDTQARDRDKIFEEFGARLFVDPKSFLYLNGTTLEYEETLMRQGFVFQNPNAARNCGCGSSFTA